MKSIKFLLAAMVAMSIATTTYAQVKVGSNPTTITTNTNLEVEATNGSKVVVKKDNGNVGINITTPTNKLHIIATANPLRAEGVVNSTSSSDKILVIDNTGVVKTALASESNFSGVLSTDFVCTATVTIEKIIVQNELLDLGNEYNSSTGLFTPVSSGIYVFELEISASALVEGSGPPFRNAMGLVSASTNQWVGRFNFGATTDVRSFYCKGIANLIAGQSYYFGVSSSQDGDVVTITSNPTGYTGSGIGTFFSIQRLN
jgi:hypothetical protein